MTIPANQEARSFARFVDAVPDIGGENAEGLGCLFHTILP